MNKQDYFLGVAISEYLSSWDDDMTNQQIIEALHNEDWDSVTIWEPFERYDGYRVAEMIEEFAARLSNLKYGA